MSSGAELAAVFGYSFRNDDLRLQALTHATRVNESEEGRPSNERLAHLGDAVIEVIVREHLYHGHPNADKKFLSENDDLFTNNPALAKVARSLGLGRFLQRGAGLTVEKDNETVLAQLYEALIGAVYLDGGLESARRIVSRHLRLPPL
jgi:ribonuclease-3